MIVFQFAWRGWPPNLFNSGISSDFRWEVPLIAAAWEHAHPCRHQAWQQGDGIWAVKQPLPLCSGSMSALLPQESLGILPCPLILPQYSTSTVTPLLWPALPTCPKRIGSPQFRRKTSYNFTWSAQLKLWPTVKDKTTPNKLQIKNILTAMKQLMSLKIS